MEFSDSKPIYVQIADGICEQILAGHLLPEARIASVREWGAQIGVNPNTVARSYDLLTEQGVIYQKRGIGFFVCENAKEVILAHERKTFVEQELPALKKRAALLGLDLKDLI